MGSCRRRIVCHGRADRLPDVQGIPNRPRVSCARPHRGRKPGGTHIRLPDPERAANLVRYQARNGMTPLLVLAVVTALLLLLVALPGFTPRINARRHPHGLAALEQVPVNGTRQWVLIRSEDVANPVLLFVHGGPGTSMLTLLRRNMQPLERAFTVVNWDQRCAGKSFAAGRDASRLTMAQFVDDIIDLSGDLARRFHQAKIVLVGHSWGSVISMLAVARRPDLFAAYVGIGQGSSMAESELCSYEWTLEQARHANDRTALEQLTRIGPPPYDGPGWRSKFMTERRLLGRYGGEYYGSRVGAFGVVLKQVLLSTEYTATDRINVFRGIFRSVAALVPELVQRDLFTEVPEVAVPVVFCLGRHDFEVPSALSARYFAALKAPLKKLVWFENSAHLPNTEERDRFNEVMLETVLPLLRASG
jgi:pimeloyl-ACP methyl ester carboxylesterase